ncbi:LLM class flavin-dependent oxidoreductase [Microbacterium sp. zg.Y1090]|uniref:LLM class flavin-dependent oxidoreductase n=1 Tax=Microbacterium TaxID=33882 RepID=UPI00214AAB13|nr:MULTISPECIES: LLM class flavin-dependent oxidoreductase [unclassified Microbacterium]MCR2812271.1 LLM class flavin-dependent oxidoreductase [Microbacterium sp. zg.Y1084]MCR2819955.1 LLM class flavin-dependent oxidoreductase [Microbacterium sp. zg.Y1090]MDL5488187.1 LLM class flavin-dependent oxidoreductase [Microbacterium sp. zg-Y1211]WIM29314.1 LLM class flavin-dependent oxidoreductase [Microbacterium sp. zg-Y1090]
MLSIGIAAAAGPQVAAALAPVLEENGFHALWVNDTPGVDALPVLAAAAAASERLVLSTGVLPIDRRDPDDIVDAMERLGLPQHRLTLGIGSGGLRAGALARVGDAAAALRERTTARVVVGALGPRMRRQAAEQADGVLLSWLDPATAAVQAVEAHAAAGSSTVALYVRTAVDAAADPALRAETARYAGYPAYAAHFARLGLDPARTVIHSSADLGAAVAAYEAAVDEVVLRAITAGDAAADYVSFATVIARRRAGR